VKLHKFMITLWRWSDLGFICRGRCWHHEDGGYLPIWFFLEPGTSRYYPY